MDYRIFPPEEILETTVRLPLSKSIAARVLVMGALTPGAAPVYAGALPDCSDTRVLREALTSRQGVVDVADCGTAARFLTAYFAATPGCEVTLTGSPRLCARPIAPLVGALRQIGADIEYAGDDGHLPLKIVGKALRGGAVSLNATASSQFASALAMIAPVCPGGLRISLGGEIASMPYLHMTMRMMESRGIDVDLAGYTLAVGEGPYRPVAPESEPDWSAASYWYSIAAVTAGWVTLTGVTGTSIQGDRVLADIGGRFGVVTEFTDEGAELSATPDLWSRLDMDMGDYPDLVPAIAVTAYLVGLPFHFTGVANLRNKESDRIETLCRGLKACGAVVAADNDSIRWDGERIPLMEMPQIDPAADHRIAMAFAAASVFIPGIVIRDIEAAEKSYPEFWNDLRAAGFTLSDASLPLPQSDSEERS